MPSKLWKLYQRSGKKFPKRNRRKCMSTCPSVIESSTIHFASTGKRSNSKLSRAGSSLAFHMSHLWARLLMLWAVEIKWIQHLNQLIQTSKMQETAMKIQISKLVYNLIKMIINSSLYRSRNKQQIILLLAKRGEDLPNPIRPRNNWASEPRSRGHCNLNHRRWMSNMRKYRIPAKTREKSNKH